MTQEINSIRRQFMQSLVAVPWVAALTSLHSRIAWAAGTSPLVGSPYGPLVEVKDDITRLPLLRLPVGFSYQSFSWTGDVMGNGVGCPGSHDGMGAFIPDPENKPNDIWLIRNHEIGAGTDGNYFGAGYVYDRGGEFGAGIYANGGTTSLLFKNGSWEKVVPTLGGTRTNCAGGVTPWGTWLSCEEEGNQGQSSNNKKHGYVFEVQPEQPPGEAHPIVAMGRFKHEAVAVHPATSTVYMTEDSLGRAGLYRYVPHATPSGVGTLALGGALEMAKVVGLNNVDIRLAEVGQTYDIEWVRIVDPDLGEGPAFPADGGPELEDGPGSGPFRQGYKLGGLRMNRGEGISYHKKKIYIMDTAGGAAKRGAIWALDVSNQAIQSLTCFYVSGDAAHGNMGDNIVVSPRGGVLVCEDPNTDDEIARMMGITREGGVFVFAENNYNVTKTKLKSKGKRQTLSGSRKDGEFCGACYDPRPNGKWLFVNQQDPGITFAITGPWGAGPL